MTDYKKLVKALRCGEYKPECGSSDCPYWSGLGCMDGQACEDAAAAIEDMAKHITEMHERVTVLQIARGELEAEVDALKHDIERYVQMNTELLNDRPELEEIGGKWVWKEPKRGEWELIDGAEPMRWGCSRCKYLSWETSNYCPRCGAKMEVQDGKD